MVDKSKKGKKGSITEEGVATLLQRYSATTVLDLLREVAQVAGDKIDWNKMAKNTATDITNPREYHMLWRHLAYGETLADQLEDDANTMGDDSDLEYELEAFPSVGREASTEAAACVKVLIASGCLNDSHLPNNQTIEAPLTINIPSNKPLAAPSDGSLVANQMQGTNIGIAVSVQKQPLSSGICGEKRPNNGALAADMLPRRKRRGWSAEEDMKLTTAVQKYGERNWANIARGDFKNDRKASELSQRWASLRKKRGNANAGASSQLSETQLAAAHRAMSLALNMPMGDNLKGSSQIGIDHQQLGRSGLGSSQLQMKRPSINPASTPDSMIKATAVAAGARIATSADASSLIEAARSQNVVHITTAVSPVIKSSTPGISSQLPSNVHFIRNGLAKAPISTYSSTKPNITRPVEAQQAQGCGTKTATSAAQPPNPASTGPMLNVISGLENTTAYVPSASAVAAAALLKTAEDAGTSTSPNDGKGLPLADQGADQAVVHGCALVAQVPGNQSKEAKKLPTSDSANALNGISQGHQASTPASAPTSKTQDDQLALPCSQVEGNGKKGPKNQTEIHENLGKNRRHPDLPSAVPDG